MVNASLSRTLTETANLISNPIREDHLEEDIMPLMQTLLVSGVCAAAQVFLMDLGMNGLKTSTRIKDALEDLIDKWYHKIRLGRLYSIEVQSFIYEYRKLIQTLPQGEKRNLLVSSLDKMIEAAMDGNKRKLAAIVNDVKKHFPQSSVKAKKDF